MRTQKHGEAANATTNYSFGLFGPRQCGVAPGVDQQLLHVADQQLQLLRSFTREASGLIWGTNALNEYVFALHVHVVASVFM